MRKITALSAGVLLLILLLSSCKSPEQIEEHLNNTYPPLDINITQEETEAVRLVKSDGICRMLLSPDAASITFYLTAYGDSQEKAQAAYDGILNRLEEGATLLGIENSDVSASAPLSVPRFEYQDNQKALVDGYDMSGSVTVRVERTEILNCVISAGLKAGAYEARDLTFSLDDPQDAYTRALSEATHDAARKAALLAEETGITIKPEQPYYIEENGPQNLTTIISDMEFTLESDLSRAISVPAIPITASILTAYEIIQPNKAE